MWFRYPRPQLPTYERCTATDQSVRQCELISDSHEEHAAVTGAAIVRWYDHRTYRYPRQNLAWLRSQLWASPSQQGRSSRYE
jgi:hypothetical protein